MAAEKKLKELRREVRDMTAEQAAVELAKERRNLFDLRLQSQRGEVKDVRQFAKTRKQIARLEYKLRMAALEAALGDDDEVEFIEAPDEDDAGSEEA